MIELAPGQIIHVAEPHYAFGTGTLKMKITEHLGEYTFGGDRWAELKGRDVRHDGTLDARERYASVRVQRVRVVAEERSAGGATVTK